MNMDVSERGWVGEHELDWSGSEKGQMAGSCDWGNEDSGSIKCG